MMRERVWMVCLLLLFPVGAAHAQDEILELLRADLRADKVAIVTAALPMNTAERDLFWPVYRDYENELGQLVDRRIQLLKKYADTHKRMNEEMAKALVKEWFSLQEDRTELWKKYYKKLEKTISARLAARFLQIEHQIALLIDLQVVQEVPLVQAPGSSDSGG